jgi:hypothetical protein
MMSGELSMPGVRDIRKLAQETFLRVAAPALVVEVAEILGRRGIPVMPLKGALLQKLVYDPDRFRPIVDVDVLVPQARFREAYDGLRTAGFSDERWEPGDWQVSLKRPGGSPLGIDLHHRLTRTARSRLTGDGLFERGTGNTQLFGAPVVIPCAEDLLAHLLLHATLHWIRYDRLHRPDDFQAVTTSLAIDPVSCAGHFRRQGLVPHAIVFLPKVLAPGNTAFSSIFAAHLRADRRERAAAWAVETICARFEPGHPARRIAGLALSPSLAGAAMNGIRDRWSLRRRERTQSQGPRS